MIKSLIYLFLTWMLFTLLASVDGQVTKTGIQWGNCTNPRLQRVNAQCGFVSVPLNHKRPRGARIRIAISRVRHNASAGRYQGVNLVNPGGPGIIGLTSALLGTLMPENISSTYDWIGLDLRGLGSSEPAISCIPDYSHGPLPTYDPSTQALEDFWLNRSRQYAQACAKKYPVLIKHMTSLDMIKDMEWIRMALGVSQINFFGFSYGAYLGQLYATLYPSRVRRMVLDSNVDPSHGWFQSNLAQNVGFEKTFSMWLDWVSKYDSLYHLGNKSCEVRNRWIQAMKDLAKNPAGGKIGPAQWNEIFISVGYKQLAWVDLASAFSNWVNKRNANDLLEQYSESNENEYAIYVAVICSDTRWPRNWKNVRNIYWQKFFLASFFTWSNAWYNGPCHFWRRRGQRPPIVDGSRVGDILLIGETFDGPSPFKDSIEVRRRFPGARLIEVVNGTSHANSLGGNQCVRAVVFDYLASGKLPSRLSGDRSDVECSALPLPNPLERKAVRTNDDILLDIFQLGRRV